MTTTIKVLPKGQITLPRKLRTALRINEGDTLLLEQTKDAVVLRKGKTIHDFLGALPSKGRTVAEMREIAAGAVAKERAQGLR